VSRSSQNVLRWVGWSMLALFSFVLIVYVIFLWTYQPIEHPPIIVEEPPASYTDAPTPIYIDEEKSLSETMRKKIFYQVGVIEREAIRESELKYPLPEPWDSDYSRERLKQRLMKQYDYMDYLVETRVAFLCRQCGIDDEQIREICVEGVEKGWH
jgi:hypothetical protein